MLTVAGPGWTRYPESFQTLVNETDPGGLHPRRAYDYARIALDLGLNDRAITFARAGLAKVPEQAEYLRGKLAQLLTKIEAD